MKIELEVPDWVVNRRILILAGGECVAQKMPDDDHWNVKVDRCNHCGECCLDSPPTPYGLDDEGKCVKLVLERGVWECTAGLDKPLRCVLDPNLIEYGPCNITHRKVKA